MEILGFKLSRNKGTTPSTMKAVVPPSDDGAIDTYKSSGYYGTYLDMDATAKSEQDLIKKYRDMSLNADVDMAIEDIVDAAIANLEEDDPVEIDLEKLKVSDKVKKAIEDEFEYLCNAMEFQFKAHELFRRWYIDGRLFFQKVIDTAKKEEGIKDIRYIDPRKIKKVRHIEKKKDPNTGVETIGNIDEFYVFSEKGFTSSASTNIATGNSSANAKLHKDTITFVPSGLRDEDNNMVLSYLHVGLKPANQLRMMENALVIYRLARAPERRIFYIDVGNLPKIKAEQYIKDIMNRYRNKLVYDSSTGEVRDDKRHMSMLEDFWLPRREGGKGTQIDTLPGGQNLGEIDDIKYFQRKLYESLKVPMSRMEKESGMNFGKAAEIGRDELKFVKFVNKLQNKFSMLFHDLLKTQLILKNIITEEDWDKYKHNIRYKFAQDAFYAETKKQEVLKMRGETLALMANFAEIYYPVSWVQKEVMQFTDDQIKEFSAKMKPATMVTEKPDPKEKK